MQLNRTSIVVPAAVLGLWLAIGLGLVPALLESAGRGSGPALLIELLDAHPDVSIDFLLEEWYGIVVAGAAAILALAALAFVLSRSSVAGRFVGEATPADIGAIRMIVCTVLLISVVWEDLPSTASLPREMIRPMGVLQLLHLIPGFDLFLTSDLALGALKACAIALLIFGIIGWKIRVVLPMAAVAYLIIGGILRQYAWFYHTGLLALYLLIVLSLLPSHHGASIDRLRNIWKGVAVPSGQAKMNYGWMRYALWATLAIPYVAAGLSKLRNGGLTWWEASNFKFILFQSALRPMEFDFDVSLLLTSAPDAVFEFLAITAVAGELLYGLVLFSRTARWVMPATMALMHVGILFLQNILFFDLIVLQAIFFNYRPLLRRFRGAIKRRRGQVQLVYDGTVASHVRLARMVTALDVLDRIALQKHGESGRFTASHGGQLFSGDSVYRRLALSLPAFWLILPVFYSSALVKQIGRAIAPADAPGVAEGTMAASQMSGDALRAPFPPPQRLRTLGPRFTVTLAAILCFFWVFRIEFYPFTGMQMFSTKRAEPVTYETVLARLASGETVRAPIEKCIGAMSDSRYRRVMQMAFDPGREAITAAFLDSCRTRWNLGANSPADRIRSFEVQQWQWYYMRDPANPTYGEMTDRRVFPKIDNDGNGHDSDVMPAPTSETP